MNLDKNMDFSGYSSFPGGNPYDMSGEQDPFFNPMMQYEQGYMYYRYLSQQMDYKIKCKEYDKLCNGRSDRKIE